MKQKEFFNQVAQCLAGASKGHGVYVLVAFKGGQRQHYVELAKIEPGRVSDVVLGAVDADLCLAGFKSGLSVIS